jgi:hypothetical protein
LLDRMSFRCLQPAYDHLAGAVQRTEERVQAAGVPE